MSVERRYGKWAYNTAGNPEDPANCIAEAVDPTSGIRNQCKKKRGHGPDGLYCKRHGDEAQRRKGKTQ